MQTAAYFPQPLVTKPASGDPLRISVVHLLSRAYTLPCSAAAQAYTQLVQPMSRFQLALDVLLPLLDSPVELQQRILVSYILYSLYAPHPIAINPFKSALVSTFLTEKENATKAAASGGATENEQLVWVLWKILRGDGSDIGPFTPSNLARSPVPPRLRAVNLSLDEDTTDRPKFDPFGDHISGSVNREEQAKERKPSVGNESSSSLSQFPAAEFEVSAQRDKETEKVSQGMTLLLAARDRVLTLSEQRSLLPLIPQLTSPPVITSVDLAPIISNNPSLAHPIVASLLLQSPSPDTSTYLEVLRHLPPTLPSFDLLGRLLRDATMITDAGTGGRTTIADLVRSEVLGWFIHDSISWLDRAEEEEKAGTISDDRFAKGVQHLCRFYNSLINFSIVDPASDADSTEMMHFTLRNARFEEANALYRVLVSGNF